MTRKVHAVFDGKVFCPEEPVELEINAHYVLSIDKHFEQAGFIAIVRKKKS
ncbi:MAG: hypothetical protein ACE5IY_20335 [bacterium]